MRNLTKNKIILVIFGFIFGSSILTSSNFKYYHGVNYENLEEDTTDNKNLKS